MAALIFKNYLVWAGKIAIKVLSTNLVLSHKILFQRDIYFTLPVDHLTQIAITMRNKSLAFAITPILFAATSLCGAATFQIKLVTDNDFAVYAGTTTSITRELYQNGVVWNDQITAASSFNLSLLAGETNFYILAMGGGGQENLSGTVNGVNIVKVFNDNNSLVRVSVPIQALLPTYNTSTVTTGSYTPDLTDVQTAFAGAIWLAPTTNTTEIVINNNPEAQVDLAVRTGFTFGDSTAVFYRFESENLNIPEPTSITLLGVGMIGLLRRKRR